jgi:hypothetical protein
MFFAVLSALGQGAEVKGRLTDSAHNAIADATVILTDVATGNTYTAHSSASGEFSLNSIPDGEYSIKARATATSYEPNGRWVAKVQGATAFGEVQLLQEGCILLIDATPADCCAEEAALTPKPFGPTSQQWLDASNVSRFSLPGLRHTPVAVRSGKTFLTLHRGR